MTLMGYDAGAEISPHDIAQKTNTVSYDVISSFTKRLPRVYIKNNRPVAYKSLAIGLQEITI